MTSTAARALAGKKRLYASPLGSIVPVKCENVKAAAGVGGHENRQCRSGTVHRWPRFLPTGGHETAQLLVADPTRPLSVPAASPVGEGSRHCRFVGS